MPPRVYQVVARSMNTNDSDIKSRQNSKEYCIDNPGNSPADKKNRRYISLRLGNTPAARPRRDPHGGHTATFRLNCYRLRNLCRKMARTSVAGQDVEIPSCGEGQGLQLSEVLTS